MCTASEKNCTDKAQWCAEAWKDVSGKKICIDKVKCVQERGRTHPRENLH